jgi:hypothetical protein
MDRATIEKGFPGAELSGLILVVEVVNTMNNEEIYIAQIA